jgi:hypothetical protein
MSKRFTYYGSKSSSGLFLDDYPNTDYFIGAIKGKINPESAMISVERGNTGVIQSFTPDEIVDGTLQSFLGANEGRISQLLTRGLIAGRQFNQGSSAARPLIADASGNLYLEGAFPFINFDGARDITTGNSADRINRGDFTVYWIYRSQNALDNAGIFEEQSTSTTFRVVYRSNTNAISNPTFNTYAPTGTNEPLFFSAQQPTNTLRILCIRKTGFFMEAFDESGLVDSRTVTAEFSAINTSFRLGLQTAGTQRFNGRLCAVVARLQADSDTTIANIFAKKNQYFGV